MYNRYIPQNDGSFRRSCVSDPPNCNPQPQGSRGHPPKEPKCAAETRCKQPESCAPPPPPCPPPNMPKPDPCRKPPAHTDSAGNFLRNLLPKDFDTGDLIVILLLLLLAGDCEEDRGTALLTLVLYLFM